MNNNLVLCGFMGSGKSTVGQLLAQKLGWEWIDMDTCIEKESGLSIPEIFRAQGEERFREMEYELAVRLSQKKKKVISSGGGALTFERNVQAFSSSLIVFLNPGFPVCYQRIQNTDRPLAALNSKEKLQRLFEERVPLYRSCCQLEIDGDLSVQETVDRILNWEKTK